MPLTYCILVYVLCLVSPPPAGRAGQGDPCHIVCLQAHGWVCGLRWHPGVQGGLRWTRIPCRWEPLHTGWSLLPLGRPAVISPGSLTTWKETKQFLSSHMVWNEASCHPPSHIPLWSRSQTPIVERESGGKLTWKVALAHCTMGPNQIAGQ